MKLFLCFQQWWQWQLNNRNKRPACYCCGSNNSSTQSSSYSSVRMCCVRGYFRYRYANPTMHFRCGIPIGARHILFGVDEYAWLFSRAHATNALYCARGLVWREELAGKSHATRTPVFYPFHSWFADFFYTITVPSAVSLVLKFACKLLLHFVDYTTYWQPSASCDPAMMKVYFRR